MSYASEAKKPNKILVGNRIPKTFFITSGKGESNLTIHAGSYHLALKDAEIERCNIKTYSSILPKIAVQIEKTSEIINNLTHGAELNTIMACANAEKGQRATAGIIFAWLYDINTGEKYGGLVCEYNGSLNEQECREMLKQNLQELYSNGYSEKFELKDETIIINSFIPEKKYGTILVALCFINYELPVESKNPLMEKELTAEISLLT